MKIKKIVTVSTISLLLVSSLTNTVLAKEFSDVKEKDWFYNTINTLSDKGVIDGYPDGSFKPNSTISSAEFLTLLNNKVGEKQENYIDEEGNWYLNTINFLKSKQVIGKVNPTEKIKRKDVALYTAKALENLQNKTLETKAPALEDYNGIDNNYKEAVAKVYNAGVMTGDEHNKFNAEAYLTRAEAAQIVKNLENIANNKPQPKPQPKPIDNGEMNTERGIFYENRKTLVTDLSHLPKEGDTVVKADGTKVILKKGPHGVLGEGQGVAPYKGLYSEITGHTFGDGDLGLIGTEHDGQVYSINPRTGEGHFKQEWEDILDATMPQYKGKKGEYDKTGNWHCVDTTGIPELDWAQAVR